jgi:hypothetical protein
LSNNPPVDLDWSGSWSAMTSPQQRIYGRLLEEAWDRRICMLCSSPMEKPVMRELVRSDGRSVGAKGLGRDACLEAYAWQHGRLAAQTEVIVLSRLNPRSGGPCASSVVEWRLDAATTRTRRHPMRRMYV